MTEAIYDFWGGITDRSEIGYVFDGLTAKITVEEQSSNFEHIEVEFSSVARFEFQSIATYFRYPSEIAEKLIVSELTPEESCKINPDYNRVFAKGLKRYEIFFNDFGSFTVIACAVNVKKLS